MSAWERSRAILRGALPVVVGAAGQGWADGGMAAETAGDAARRMFWWSHVPGSGAPDSLAVAAVAALENKGRELPEAAAVLDAGLAAVHAGDMEALAVAHMRLWTLLRAATPARQTRLFADWPAFEAAVDWPADEPVDVRGAAFRDATSAGWLGQVVGAAAGTALEGYTMEALARRFGEITEYVRPPDTYNDDITYEIALLDAYAACGPALTAADIAARWVGMIPFGWSAEAIALDNLGRGVPPPDSGRIGNPFDEWIGAQMRGGVCGMLAPGRAREAARLAWLDGSISHTSNGILGEVFNAVLTARAYAAVDLRMLLASTVALFPTDTEYGQVLAWALDTCRAAADWRAAWRVCDARLERYHWIHAYPNAAAEVVALWFGHASFDAMLAIACGIGHDADCNAAQVLGVFAIVHGGGCVHRRWTDPLGPDLLTYMRRPRRTSVGQLTAWTVDAVRRWTVSPSARA